MRFTNPIFANPAIRGLRRKLRWLAGSGWSAEDFAQRYATAGADAWGYRASPQHRRRAEWIMAGLPAARFARALEVGCAQGFISEQLAARADRLVACDLSPEAVRQARETCRALSHVEFHVADIRNGFPGDGFDLVVFSDVLYYLSPREIDAVLEEAARRIAPGGTLLVANEWNLRAKGLTSPAYSFSRLDASPAWERTEFLRDPFGEIELSMGIYRRVTAK